MAAQRTIALIFLSVTLFTAHLTGTTKNPDKTPLLFDVVKNKIATLSHPQRQTFDTFIRNLTQQTRTIIKQEQSPEKAVKNDETTTEKQSELFYLVETSAFRGFIPSPCMRSDKTWYLGSSLSLGFMASCIMGWAIGFSPRSHVNEGLLMTGTGAILASVAYWVQCYQKTKNEDVDIEEFFRSQWAVLRTKLTWPPHMKEIFDYLSEKMVQGEFDLEEARQCLIALQTKSDFD